MYPNGLMVSTDAFRFDRDEDEKFRRFLRSVPKPTLWDKTGEARANLGAWALIAFVLIGGAVAGHVVWALFRAVFGSP